jgi:hypothetical protein
MEININAGFDVCRSLPPGQGIKSHHVGGFGIYMLSNHDPDDTFKLRVVALFIPGPRGTMTWHRVTPAQVIKILAAIVGYSERTFGDTELDPVDRQLIDSVLGNQ